MILAQGNLVNTDVKEVFNNRKTTDIRSINICNTSSSAIAYRIFHAKSGNTYSVNNALHYDINLPANSTDLLEFEIGSFEMAQSRETIGIRSNTSAALTYTVQGCVK